MTDDDLTAKVWDRLTQVLDPCSCFTDNPVNIVELGLVESVTVTGDTANIELLLTSPGCTYLPYIEQDVEERVSNVEGIKTVEIAQITDQIWTRERMADDVRKDRREHFRERMDAAGVTPYVERSN